MKSIAVFCGSSTGTKPVFKETAYELGKTLAEKNIELIYGGANRGLMKIVADGALQHNGKVTGIIPDFLAGKEIAHTGLSRLITVKTMHERKARMNDLAEGVIAMPGGFGTMDEFFEMLTWGQLGLHRKPVALLNIDGYYNSLISMILQMKEDGFLLDENRKMVIEDSSINSLLDKMNKYVPGLSDKWINAKQI